MRQKDPGSPVMATGASDASDIEILRERVIFNVGGTRFETYRSTLTARPSTFLGTMFAERNHRLLVNGTKGEFFFDRDPLCFSAVLNYHRTGKVFVPPNVSTDQLHEEFQFFQIPAFLTATGALKLAESEYKTKTAVYTWGRGDFGQLGHGDRASLDSPQRVQLLSTHVVKSISLGTSHTCCVTDTNLAFSWGYGGDGRLGHGDESDRLVPTFIESLTNISVSDIICGELHTAAIADMKVYTWGLGKDGRLGLGHRDSVFVPSEVERLAGVEISQVSCGGLHTAALTASGEVYTWGLGKNGRLGHGDEADQMFPKKLNLKNIKYVACGGHHTGVIDLKGNVFTWGFDDDGRLGHLDTGHRLRPTLVETLVGIHIIQIALGCWHSAALDFDGSVYTWGSCKSGQLGQSHKNSMPVPQVIFTGKNNGAIKIACGTAHTAALCKDGTLYTWGKNEDGRLGYIPVGDQVTPVPVQNAIKGAVVTEVVCGVYNTACICLSD